MFDGTELTRINGELAGILTKKKNDSATTLNNVIPGDRNEYYFEIECQGKKIQIQLWKGFRGYFGQRNVFIECFIRFIYSVSIVSFHPVGDLRSVVI